MKNIQSLDQVAFLEVLIHLFRTGKWTAMIDQGCIHLQHEDRPEIFSPITAVYYELTGECLHRGSYLHPEIEARYKLPWYEILEITYAETKTSCGGKWYNRYLRNEMLGALGLPLDKITRY